MRRLTLTPVHFFLVLSTLGGILVVSWILNEPTLRHLYLEEFLIPRLESDYSFRGGRVSFKRADATFDRWGIVQLTPESPLAAAGLRPRDVPTAYHNGLAAMYYALRDGERKRFASFDVINADDWNAGRDPTRTIVVYSPGTDLPAHFRQPDGRELMSPTVRFGLLAVERAPAHYDLVLRDHLSAEVTRIHSYARHAAAVWATSEDWIALTDHDDIRTPRCIVVHTRTAKRTNIADLAARLPAFNSEAKSGHQLACEVFGWLQGTSKAAVTLWVLDERSTASGSYFFDTATSTLTDSRAH